MAEGQVHNALRRSRLPEALGRALGDTRGATGLERYGETMTPIMDLWSMPEWCYLRNEALMSHYLAPVAVAGEYGGVALVNPPASGVLAIVERVVVSAANALNWYLAETTSAIALATYATGGLPARPRDTRIVNWTAGVCQLWSGTDPAVVGVVIDITTNVAAQQSEFRLGLPFVLSPGYALIAQSNAQNLLVIAGFSYRERKALPGELE